MPWLILARKVACSSSRREGKVKKVTMIGLKHNNKVKQTHEHQHLSNRRFPCLHSVI